MAKTNGHAGRRLKSWVDAFVDYSSNLESPPIFRKWVGIGAIAAALEQKVWIMTSAPLYPNLYTFIIGHPGVGKTRTIMAGTAFLRELPEFHIAPTSMSGASLVDALVESKRQIINMPNPPIEYNSMLIAADELSAFMHKYDDEIIGELTTFYDPNIPYGQKRRGKDINIKIKRPQLNILSGTTPSNLMKFMPEVAWDQGFTSRVIMVFSDERPIDNVAFWTEGKAKLPSDMIHDAKVINSLSGQFIIKAEFKAAFDNWRTLGLPPIPKHPKLIHYATRRGAHLLKLAMIACVDRGDTLTLTTEDFNRAMGWLLEAEVFMPDIFTAGGAGADAKAMDEIYHFILVGDMTGKGVKETHVVNFARNRVPAHSVLRVIEVMEKSGLIRAEGYDAKLGLRYFKAVQ